MAEKLEASGQALAFPQSRGCVRGKKTGAKKMMEAIKFMFTAALVVSLLTLVVFFCCFGAWLFDKWRKER
ncbi:MAG: hypothetical protein EBT75_09960 [Proteobacteria bacterium]|nr:hypothetical protein [Pseudomonadota bacterium]